MPVSWRIDIGIPYSGIMPRVKIFVNLDSRLQNEFSLS